MKVLFVSSGNKKFGISPIVFNQGESLKQNNIDIEYLTIKGKGLFGYLKNGPIIRSKINTNKYDLVHAHYSLSALATKLSFPKIPLVVSLMGSDTKMNLFWKFVIKINYLFFWDAVIVKSKEMKNKLNLKNAFVIPNGVDLNRFQPMLKETAQNLLGWDTDRKHILFGANVSRTEKNFTLAKLAIHKLGINKFKVHALNNIDFELIPVWLNASDLLLLTSLWEGSPNIIKEAMACNRSIVSTKVGDVKWLFGDEPGHFLTSFDLNDVAENINSALEFSEIFGRTNGRKRIIELGLDSQTVAKNIINIYKELIDKQ